MASQINASNSGFGGIVSTGDSSGVLQLQTVGTTAVTIDTSQRAAFVAGTAALPAITTTGDTNTGMFFPAADTIAFAEGGAEAMRLDSSGNVGIGTTSPASKLEISDGFSTATSTGLSLTSTNSNGYGGGIRFYVSPPTAGKYTAAFLNTENSNGTANDGGRLKFYTAADDASHTLTERMRIDSSGNLLVSTTTTTGNGAAFQVAGSGGGMMLRIAKASEGTAHQFVVNSSVVGTIYAAPSSTSYNTSSDYRLKENIAPMTGALNVVQQLKPVTYNWKVDGSDGQGFIAHELQEVVPDCVVGDKDAVDEDGNPKYQGVDTSFLVATLTAAIQEQQTIINDLKARIETLEAK